MESIIEEHINVIKNIQIAPIKHVAEKIKESLSNNGKVIWMGNGGSAADCQHLAAEFIGRFEKERNPFASVALTTDTSILTAIGNDYGFDKIFSRQIESNGEKGDILIAISTSGNSPNILNALKTCREKGIITLGLTGGIGGAMKEFCDHVIIVPSNETPVIQESHIMIGHMICGLIEEEIFGKNK